MGKGWAVAIMGAEGQHLEAEEFLPQMSAAASVPSLFPLLW